VLRGVLRRFGSSEKTMYVAAGAGTAREGGRQRPFDRFRTREGA
jgi:hypothetical protein